MPVPFTDSPLGCSTDSHEWVANMNDRGDYYEMCRGCGKQAAWAPLSPGEAA